MIHTGYYTYIHRRVPQPERTVETRLMWTLFTAISQRRNTKGKELMAQID